MKKVWIIAISLVFVTMFLNIAGCNNSTSIISTPNINETTVPTPEKAEFNIIFRYGWIVSTSTPDLSPSYILDTFNGTFTFHTHPDHTINMSLSKEESNQIYQKMVEIDFFNYPDEFITPTYECDNCPQDSTICFSYYFYIEIDSQLKKLSWKELIPIPPAPEPTFISPFNFSPELTNAMNSYWENDLYWITNPNEQATKLRLLTILTKDIIESKDAYKEIVKLYFTVL